MTITFFKKNNNPKLELVRDLIDELDELYSDYSDISIEDRDLITPTVGYSGNERYYKRFEEIIAKIYIREKTIEQLCSNESPKMGNLIHQNLN